MKKHGLNKWESIYRDLLDIRQDIKDAMMSGYCPVDIAPCGEVWEELAHQMNLMDQYHGDNADAFVRELIRVAMIEEAEAETEDKYV